jgi:hypothetical protein
VSETLKRDRHIDTCILLMRNFHVRVVDLRSCRIDLPKNMRVSQTCIRTTVKVLYKYSLRNTGNSGYKEEADCG